MYKGACWDKTYKRWKAQIVIDKRKIHLGYFDNELDAAKVYDEKATTHYKEFACINHVLSGS